MAILTQFVLRLALGLSVSMAATSPRLVTAGYFRVHLYVVMGLNVVAVAAALTSGNLGVWLPLAGAIVAYVGSVMWLYELVRPGRIALLLAAALSLSAARAAGPSPTGEDLTRQVLAWLDPLSGGLVLGTTMAAMLLGHWYLNTPAMQLAPLRRLIALMLAAVALRAVVSGGGTIAWLAASGWPAAGPLAFLCLRWLAGIVAAAGVAVMAWLTLRIPNTQSATGILYVGVITTFLGELTAQLLAVEARLPV